MPPKAKYPSWERAYVRRYTAKKRATPEGKAYRKNQYAKHREKILARNKANYRRNPTKAVARAKAWRKANHKRSKANRRARYAQDHNRRLQKGRQYAAARKQTGKAAEYREKTRERQRAWARNRSAKLGDDYAREQLSKYSPISAKDWPQELVDVKRLEIQLKRTLRNP